MLSHLKSHYHLVERREKTKNEAQNRPNKGKNVEKNILVAHPTKNSLRVKLAHVGVLLERGIALLERVDVLGVAGAAH